MVDLAYEAAFQGFVSDSLYLLMNIDPLYFKEQCIKDFESDAEYFKKGIFLFEILKYNEWAEEYIEYTQKEAQA